MQETMATDSDLFSRWNKGDARAGQQLIHRHYDSIFFFFSRRLDATRAADLTQSTFEVVCAKPERLRLKSSFAGYLFGIARKKLLEHHRRIAGRQFDPFSDSTADSDEQSSLSSLIQSKRHESMLVRALRTLSLDDQIMLEMRIGEGLKLREIAAVLGISENRLSTRMATAKRRLIKKVEELSQGEETLTSIATYMRNVRELWLRSPEAEARASHD